MLNGNKAFAAVIGDMNEKQRRDWRASVTFFETQHQLLKDWRNDMGGHFLDRTAEHVLDNLHEESAGAIELHEIPDSTLHGLRIKFAYDIIAHAIGRGHDDGGFEPYVTKRMEFVAEAFGHAAQAMHIIVQVRLWRQFG